MEPVAKFPPPRKARTSTAIYIRLRNQWTRNANVASANDFEKRLTAVKLFLRVICSMHKQLPHGYTQDSHCPMAGSAASHAYDVSTVHRESLPIIILHSSMVWITREWRRDRTTLLSSKKTCDDTHAGPLTYKKHASSCRSNIESLAVLCSPEFVKSDWL